MEECAQRKSHKFVHRAPLANRTWRSVDISIRRLYILFVQFHRHRETAPHVDLGELSFDFLQEIPWKIALRAVALDVEAVILHRSDRVALGFEDLLQFG